MLGSSSGSTGQSCEALLELFRSIGLDVRVDCRSLPFSRYHGALEFTSHHTFKEGEGGEQWVIYNDCEKQLMLCTHRHRSLTTATRCATAKLLHLLRALQESRALRCLLDYGSDAYCFESDCCLIGTCGASSDPDGCSHQVVLAPQDDSLVEAPGIRYLAAV